MKKRSPTTTSRRSLIFRQFGRPNASLQLASYRTLGFLQTIIGGLSPRIYRSFFFFIAIWPPEVSSDTAGPGTPPQLPLPPLPPLPADPRHLVTQRTYKALHNQPLPRQLERKNITSFRYVCTHQTNTLQTTLRYRYNRGEGDIYGLCIGNAAPLNIAVVR